VNWLMVPIASVATRPTPDGDRAEVVAAKRPFAACGKIRLKLMEPSRMQGVTNCMSESGRSRITLG
jgi:hypothetical protein